MVELLQGLQTLGHVLVVYFGVEGVHVLLAESLCTEDVEPDTFLQQLNTALATQLLLGDLLYKTLDTEDLEPDTFLQQLDTRARNSLETHKMRAEIQFCEWKI